ncbi:hypothetical protein CAP35_00990 [Chitinophagaceae bacterium IBVUCB1]|nr:hypothetical protein CAP35_00990 [Chitinophagaceae bacterium IBVUCB1]
MTANSGAGMARLGYYLSEALDKKGILKDFIVYSKGKFTTTFKSSPVSPLSRYVLFFLNKLNSYFHFAPHKFRLLQEYVYDWFCVSKINKDTGILFVTQPYLPRTFKKAKRLDIPIIFIPANPEENYIRKMIIEEQKKLDIVVVDAYTYAARIALFNKSIQYIDKVIGTYPTVYDTYKASDFKGEVIKMIGHIKPDFNAVSIENTKANTGTFKVGYLAHTVALKGLHYLLEAWQQLKAEHAEYNIELYIAGKIDTGIKSYIDEHFSNLSNVKYMGKIPDAPAFLKTLDLFVVPSLIDGGPYTALEAAHYAIPVLITENCGSAELLARNESGCVIVPIRDAKSIKEKIEWAYNNREAIAQMGMNAKYNLDTYRMDELVNDIANYLENNLKKINN